MLALSGQHAYAMNMSVFEDLSATITHYPAGKPSDENKKRVIVFSPHPDDDVISMGGTLLRLVEHGHEVHVCYQV